MDRLEHQEHGEEELTPFRYGVDKVAEVMSYPDNLIKIRYRAGRVHTFSTVCPMPYTPERVLAMYTEISPDWPLCQIFCCGPCKSDKLLRRTYLHVHHNRIEYNYPLIIGGIFVVDRVGVTYFDRAVGYHTRSKWCTPFHCCGLLESCGEVMKEPVFECCTPDWCNCLFCPVFRWYPGLHDAEATVKEVRSAYQEWLNSHPGGAPVYTPPEPASM